MIQEIGVLLKEFGFEVSTIALLFICLILSLRALIKNSKLNDDVILLLSSTIKEIKKFSFNGYLNTDLSIDLYRVFAHSHTARKCEFLLNVLIENDIDLREEEIKRNIKSEFYRITSEEAEDLSMFKSVVGDMGKLVSDNIDWDEYFDDTFNIVFNKKSSVEQKISDFRTMIALYIVKIEKIVRKVGEQNE